MSISLDTWTSSNQHAFLAIVVHYVTNDWRHGSFHGYDKVLLTHIAIEEFLLDFRELMGQHSGENMMDNATNNDTMANGLEARFKLKHIRFVAVEAHIRGFPHTAHLSALEVSCR